MQLRLGSAGFFTANHLPKNFEIFWRADPCIQAFRSYSGTRALGEREKIPYSLPRLENIEAVRKNRGAAKEKLFAR